MAPRRRDLWRQDVLSRRHILQRRLPESISAKSYKKSTYVKLFREMAKLQKLRPVAPQPGGQDRPPRCRETGPQGPARNFLRKIFFRNAPAAPLPGGQVPAARQRGGRVYFCKFSNQKYIFVKYENKK